MEVSGTSDSGSIPLGTTKEMNSTVTKSPRSGKPERGLFVFGGLKNGRFLFRLFKRSKKLAEDVFSGGGGNVGNLKALQDEEAAL